MTKTKVHWCVCLHRRTSHGLCAALELEDFGSDVNCLSKSQCFWASRWLTCTRGGGGHLGSLSAGNFPNAVEPNETTYMKAICKTYSMRQLLTSIC